MAQFVQQHPQHALREAQQVNTHCNGFDEALSLLQAASCDQRLPQSATQSSSVHLQYAVPQEHDMLHCRLI
jgi:hypothetical protein